MTFFTLERLAISAQLMAVLIGYVGILVIAFGCLKGFARLLRAVLHTAPHLASIRRDVGQYLVLGLEFLVGKDIIESLVQPTWDQLGKLSVIILLRTVLTLFLSYEVREAKE